METPVQTEFVPRLLNGSQAKTAYALRQNCERMCKLTGIQSVGFLTLTVGQKVQRQGLFGPEIEFQQVWDAKEANRRVNNALRRLLKSLFELGVIVTERHKSGAIHFHLLGVLRGRPDIRSGFDWDALDAVQAGVRKRRRRFWRGDEVNASPALRGAWATLRARLPGLGFGRAELLPVRKTGEAVSSYVSKYIEKNVCNRLPEDKHKKLVRYFGDWKTVVAVERPGEFAVRLDIVKRNCEANKPVHVFGDMPSGPGGPCKLRPNDFCWTGKKALAWWAKTTELFELEDIATTDQAYHHYGPRWAWTATKTWKEHLGEDLEAGLNLTLDNVPKIFAALRDERERWLRLVKDCIVNGRREMGLEQLAESECMVRAARRETPEILAERYEAGIRLREALENCYAENQAVVLNC